MTFIPLGLRKELLDAIERMGFKTPTPIQREVIHHFKQNPTEFGGRKVNVAFAGNAKPEGAKKSKPRR